LILEEPWYARRCEKFLKNARQCEKVHDNVINARRFARNVRTKCANLGKYARNARNVCMSMREDARMCKEFTCKFPGNPYRMVLPDIIII
jgi:plasmid stabilization system protein ParE